MILHIRNSVVFHATKLKLGLETILVSKGICVFTNSFLHSINFRSNSPVNVHRCGNIYYIFGHVHKIRSYSFDHLHSVMLTFLIFLNNLLNI